MAQRSLKRSRMSGGIGGRRLQDAHESETRHGRAQGRGLCRAMLYAASGDSSRKSKILRRRFRPQHEMGRTGSLTLQSKVFD